MVGPMSPIPGMLRSSPKLNRISGTGVAKVRYAQLTWLFHPPSSRDRPLDLQLVLGAVGHTDPDKLGSPLLFLLHVLISIALYFYYTQEPPAGLFAANCRGFLDPHNPSPFACSKSWRTRPTRPHVLPAVVRLPLPSLLLVLLHQQRRVEAVSLRNNQTQGDGDV